jgi:hypothetical protein
MHACRRSFTLVFFSLACTIFLFSGCRKNITRRTTVYAENAEDGIAHHLLAQTGTGFPVYNLVKTFGGTNVIGFFNQTILTLALDSLPEHNMVYVEFDLYTHDKWEGNRVGLPGIVDVWNIRVNGEYQLSTSFSNVPWQQQSYPEWIGVSAPVVPRGNAADTLLPGRCLWEQTSNGSSRYRIAFSRPHREAEFLMQLNDALQGSICEKSWSIDNILIQAIQN